MTEDRKTDDGDDRGTTEPGGEGHWAAPFALVGVGVAAGGAASLQGFLGALGRPVGLAVVVVLRQGEDGDVWGIDGAPFDAVMLAADHDAPIEEGRLYFAPPATIATVEGSRLHLRTAPDRAGARATIDSFFVSLAENLREQAIGVVLRGTGGDGSLGITAIRNHGGLAIVEDEGEDAHNALSYSTHPAALADDLLAPERMPARIALHVRQLVAVRAIARPPGEGVTGEAALAQIANVLRNKTGHDFHGYKPNTFMRRVQRRMTVTQNATLDAYLACLRADAAEPQNLFNDLLIGVTQFFRDPKEFDLIEREVVPKLFLGKGAGDQVRVWVLGCATGEEAYSIGILLREHMLTLDAAPQVQIFATDIDGRALAAARVGRYTDRIVGDVPPARLARWFVREGNTYAVAKEVREMCIFCGHNVLRDAPFSRLDLISCRNLLIYLNTDLQSRVIPLFHFALRSQGVLFLGNAENVTRHTKLFSPLDQHARVFRRVDTAARVVPDFPLSAATSVRVPIEAPGDRRPVTLDRLARRAEQIAERYYPAYVIIDEQFDVLHFSGRTGRYLDPPSGAASLNLLNLVHRDLRLDLRASLQRVIDGDKAARTEGVRMEINGDRMIVDLVVEAMGSQGEGPRSYVVVFKDGSTVQGDDGAGSFALTRDEHVRRLESELRTSRDVLQSTIEELESTNEELKSSNEEYQSLNEELQSANEELETSKEELQSINEELTTVNDELAQRVHELARANSDLKNLFESTQIATIFLDNDLRVMNYTPAVTDIFPLIASDVGRPISNIRARLPLDELQDDASRVLRTLGSVERQIDIPSTHARYIMRLLPYRSTDNFIAGVVVTFVDISPLTRAEGALRESDKRFRDLTDLSPDGILIHAAGRIVYANAAAAQLLGAPTVQAITGMALVDLIGPDDIKATVDRIAAVELGDVSPPGTVGFLRRDGTIALLEAAAGRIRWEGRAAVQMLMRDVGERRRWEQRQALLLAELQHRVRNTLAVLRSIARRTAESSQTVEDYSAHLDGRIAAFARVQAAVTRDPAMGVSLGQMLTDELLTYQAQEGGQVTIEGPPVRFRAKAAENFCLAIHELATNAVKHGALAKPIGHVTVEWTIDAPARRLDFTWTEHGLGGVAAPSYRGFGTELLERTLAFELKARTSLDFGRDGFRCRIGVPLDHLA